jgi:hypothetical protein
LLAATGRSGLRRRGSPPRATPALSLAALRRDEPLTPAAIERIVESELHLFGAIGTVLEGLLYLHCLRDTGSHPARPDVDAIRGVELAEHCWARAAEADLHSTWLAYGLGQYWYRHRDYGRAQAWLDLARGELIDPLEGHAQVLAALCSAKLGDFTDAADRAAGLAAVFPLNERICSLAMATATGAGRDADPEIAARHLKIITMWTNGDDSR